jgi:hypothetical protein
VLRSRLPPIADERITLCRVHPTDTAPHTAEGIPLRYIAAMKRNACAALVAVAAALTSCSSGGGASDDLAATITALSGPSNDQLFAACENLVGTSDEISTIVASEVLLTGGSASNDADRRPSFFCDYADAETDTSFTVWLVVYPSDEEAVDGVSASGDETDHVGSVTVYLEDTTKVLSATQRVEAQRAIAERLSQVGASGREGALRSI